MVEDERNWRKSNRSSNDHAANKKNELKKICQAQNKESAEFLLGDEGSTKC